MAKQAEQAKIKMNDSKPIFTTIIYPYIPNERSNVSKIILITNYTLAGLIISVLFVVIFNKVISNKKRIFKILIYCLNVNMIIPKHTCHEVVLDLRGSNLLIK